jgi:hypothetical protein
VAANFGSTSSVVGLVVFAGSVVGAPPLVAVVVTLVVSASLSSPDAQPISRAAHTKPATTRERITIARVG